MPRSVPFLYGAAVAVLVAAGLLLSLRTAATQPVTVRVPEGCTEVPPELVDELFPEASPAREERVDERTGVPYGRWLDADGTLLLELRCSRVAFEDVVRHRGLQEAAGEDDADDVELLGTEPEAVLLRWREGVLIHQLHEGERLERVWYVRGDLDREGARRVVEATGPPPT